MSRHVTQMTIEDAPHISPERRAEIVASYPEWEREARVRGIPALGSGRVYPVTEDRIVCDPFRVPDHFAQVVGVDFGWEHPFAAVRLAWDRDSDVVYVCSAYREQHATPPIHAAAIRAWGDWIPVAWPADGLQTSKADGKPLANLYRQSALSMMSTPAAHETGGNSVEAGIMSILERMQTGRFKVFRGLDDWMAEFRLYHRDKGLIVKERDDLMDATRYGMMMLRKADVKRKPVVHRAQPATVGGWMG